MTREDREHSFTLANNYITSHTTYKWAYAFLKNLKLANQTTDSTLYAGMGIGLNYTVVRNIGNVHMLSIPHLEKHYYESKDRLIIIDQEGTLPSKELCHFESLPDDITQYLEVLSRDGRNKVFLISQQRKDQMPKFDSPNIGLGAENGFFYKWNNK